MPFDLLIRGGTVVDGTGAPGRRADVGISGDRIEAVEDLSAAADTAKVVIDATGRAVAPGFIDVHAHTDLTPAMLAKYPDIVLAGIRQGVTTEVCGNCGFTAFPTTPERAEAFGRHTATLFGRSTPPLSGMAEYRAHLEPMPKAANLAPLVGHGSLRAGVMGFDERPPTDDELAGMEAAAEEAFANGAFGLSSGLIYPPGMFGATPELVALAKVAARHGRPYTTHMRNEGGLVIDAINEALTIGREGGTGVQISHHKVSGKPNWGRSVETLELIAAARTGGADVTCDAYPYTAGSTSLSAVLPPWAHDGGAEAMLDRVRNERDRIRADMATGLPGWEDFVRTNGWESVVIASAPGRSECEGRSVAELADEASSDPLDLACELLLSASGNVLMVIHSMDEADVQRILAAPFTMIGSDGVPVPGKPHPRIAGTFVRVLGHYCRDVGLFDLPTAVHKMTGMAAERFGLSDRGVLAKGKVADLVVFDPDTVVDRSTYADPLLPPVGIDAVVVAGQLVVEDGKDTGIRAGQALRPGS